MLILEGSVIITCIAVVLWLINSRHRTQQALIWWHDRQYAKMCKEGEAIRNGLLQESFVIRRHLELSALDSSRIQTPQHQYYLTTIEKFHHSLKELSDYLFPAHIEDSLSLAIKHLLIESKLPSPELQLEMDLTVDLERDSLQVRRIILIALEEILRLNLLNIYSPALRLVALSLHLKNEENFRELKVKFNYNHLYQRTRIIEYDYLRRAFQFLTFGKCWYCHQDNTEIWYFRWQGIQT
jgi:hypothetical protein